MIKIISNSGVKKSAKEVTKGIKKLLGSLPLLNRNIEPINNKKNKTKNKLVMVKINTKMIKKGFIILIPT